MANHARAIDRTNHTHIEYRAGVSIRCTAPGPAALAIALVAAACSGDDGGGPADALTVDDAVETADAPDGGGPQPITLASGLIQPLGLAVAGGQVYFVTTGDLAAATGVVARVPTGGGAVEELATGQSRPYDLRVSDRIYWTNGDFLAADGSSVRAMALAGGASVGLASTNPGPRALAIDATTVFFAVGGGDHRVLAAPLAGGATRLVATASLSALDLEVDATHVYYLDEAAGGGRVMRVDKSGLQPPQEVSRALVNAGSLTSDATALYWTSGRDVMRADKDGGNARALATAARALGAIAVDATHVYVGELTDGRVLRVPIAGGALVAIADGPLTPAALAVDADAVYCSDLGAGAIVRIAK